MPIITSFESFAEYCESTPASASAFMFTGVPKGVPASAVTLNINSSLSPICKFDKDDTNVLRFRYSLTHSIDPLTVVISACPSLLISKIRFAVSPGSSIPSLLPAAESSIINSPNCSEGAFTLIEMEVL
jgi:hypothetical protein